MDKMNTSQPLFPHLPKRLEGLNELRKIFSITIHCNGCPRYLPVIERDQVFYYKVFDYDYNLSGFSHGITHKRPNTTSSLANN
ncbi:MAG: hypothetical protein ACMUHX_10945 [bacterium]